MFGIRYFSTPRKQLSFDAAVAGADVGAGASDGAGEDDGIIASGVSPLDSPFPVEGPKVSSMRTEISCRTKGTGLLERVGTGIVGTIGYVVLPTGVSTDVSRDIV